MIACYCDFDPPSVCRQETRYARKTHRCCECGRAIKPGERYEHVWGIWDGRPDTFKTCHICVSLREYVAAHVPCFCWNYENMREEALETLREYADQAPGLFFGGARLYVQANQLRSAL
jgi:hypothetical protein